jgi:hypothetical protein
MYSQSNFFYGGINTDDEDRLIPNTDFRNAFYSRNYGINTSDEGALQSMTGNLLRTNSNLPSGINIVIGACEDTEGKDASTSGNLIIFVWNDLDHHTIWRYSTQDLSYTKILESSILNFQLDYPVYQAAVVNNLLYWTDNYFNSYEGNDFNPPRKINIEKAILYTESGGSDPNGYSEITFDNLDWIKHPPLFSPTFIYDTDTTETANNLKNKLFQFRYQYIYDDNEESAWSPISKITLPTQSEYISQTVSLDTFIDNTIKVDVETGSSIARIIRLAYRIGNTGEFFLYKEYDKKQLEWSDYSIKTVDFKNETSGAAISNSERNYDLIPQIAKAIEYLPSNEFAIGNYVEGYDKQEITDSSVLFSVDKYPIEDTAFTYPLAAYYCIFETSVNNLYVTFNAYSDIFPKYRYQEGDTVALQLKDYISNFSNVVVPDRTIYFEVPFIDPVAFPTDIQKLFRLCVKLRTYLLELGIDSNVISSGVWGSYPALQIVGKTWYNATALQLEFDIHGGITVFRKNNAKRTFKSGAKHEFAFQYYDRANRDGTVLTVPVGEVYVPFNTDYTDNQLNDPIGLNRKPYFNNISLLISEGYQPPMWADTYQILYKPSTNIANFQQRSVKQVIFNNDSTIKLVLDNYYLNNFTGTSINQTPSRGDFVRFVRKRALFEKSFTNINLFKIDFPYVNVVATVPGEEFYSLSLSPYVSVLNDPEGTMSGGVFTAPSTDLYTFNITTSVQVSLPDPTFSMSVCQLSIAAIVSGTAYTILQSSISADQDIYTFSNLAGMYSVSLTAGQTVSFRMAITGITAGTPSPLIRVRAYSSSYSISLSAGADYDKSQYYPEYVTQESNLNQELNVLSYDPAGGPSGEDVITVNNFDPNLLGDYLLFYTPPSLPNLNVSFASGGFQIEIYTPKKENENDPWYEVGVEFPVLNPHTENRSHGGDINQLYGIRDGQINLNCGDVYIRQRCMSTGYNYTGGESNIGDANDYRGGWFCEDPHYSDYYISNWNDKGRIGLFSPFAKRQHLKSSVYHTNSFIDNSQINGLSRVEFFNNISLKEEHGSINKLVQIGDILKAFQDRKITSIYIQKAFALNGDGTNNVILSDKTFGGVRPHDDDYGSIHTGSISRVENNVFFYDYYNSAFGVVTAGGIVNICEQEKKFSKGVRDLTGRLNGIYGGYNNANIWSHINRNNNEYTFYVSDKVSSNLPIRYEIPVYKMQKPNKISLFGNYTEDLVSTEISIDGSENPENNGNFTIESLYYDVITGLTEIEIANPPIGFDNELGGDTVLYYYGDFVEASGEGISYSYERNRWITRLNHGVSFATQLGSRAYSTGGADIFKFGELFEENYGNELTFLDVPRTQELRFVFNDNPTVVKRFYTHLQQANYPFYVEVSVPANQTYPSGMESNIPAAVLKNQEGYYVSRYFRDLNDPAFTSPLEARVNGRELRGYVLKHILTNSDTSVKKILMNVGVNFAASEPIIQ